ncbi:dihydrolipoamide acetyltransferase family protein [Microbacterium keratanolyticum]|uniref:dihydrolipoamide acetyltransferase family protein n=1 Tax=Microbacterium keratanolyticum TaxID=67574 RepID=UPI00363F94E2
MTTIATRVFRLPDLGEGLTEAGLVQWLVAVGDTITTDQAIAEVETAKSVVELPSPFAGVVIALHGEPGETIDVGAPVLEVGDPDAPRATDPAGAPAAAGAAPVDKTEQEAYRAEERAGSGNVLIGYGTTERAGRGRRRARVSASPQRAAVASAAAAEVAASAAPAAPAPAQTSASEAVPASAPARRTVAVRSPLVRRLARDLGLDVHTITATGTDGAITRADVLRAAVDHAVDGVTAHTGGVASAPSRTGDHVDGLAVQAREKFSPLRKAVSATLTRSRSEIPEATVWVDVDATRLWELRSEMAAPGEKAPSITALIARFTLLALAEYPLLASRLNEAGDEITTFDGVNLGIAADTPRGLMVPVIPHAHTLSVAQLDGQLRELAETARAGQMPPERLRGSTFTLNNYGGFGVDGSAAIINHPNVAILGIGRILERPWVVDGQIVPRRIAQLSLVFDHRVCDGGYAAGFLRRVVDLIEQPLRAFGQV